MARSPGSASGDKTGRDGSACSPSADCGVVPPPRARAYIPPTQVPKESKYHTIDMKAVRLSPEIDPRRMQTQLTLRRVAIPAKRDHRHLVALCLLGASVGVGVWLGIHSSLSERRVTPVSAAAAEPGIASATQAAEVSSGAVPVGVTVGADIPLTSATADTPRAAESWGAGTGVGVATHATAAGGGNGQALEMLRSKPVSASKNVQRQRSAVVDEALRRDRRAEPATSAPGAKERNGVATGEDRVWVTPSDPKAWLK